MVFFSGHTEDISSIALSNDVTVFASAQCANQTTKDEVQTKIIVWDAKTLKQRLVLHQSVYAVQSLAFSR